MVATSALWDQLCGGPLELQLIADMTVLHTLNESRRAKAKYNTGSITPEQMAQLRALYIRQRPKTIVEVGTFIGNSTLAMQAAAARIYTCDNKNDCLPSSDVIKTFPYTGSARMFAELVKRGVKADLFFFDGRIANDLEAIRRLSHERTIYVFDDYTDYDPVKKRSAAQKGVINARAMASVLSDGWLLVEPDHRLDGHSTLAALVPKELLA